MKLRGLAATAPRCGLLPPRSRPWLHHIFLKQNSVLSCSRGLLLRDALASSLSRPSAKSDSRITLVDDSAYGRLFGLGSLAQSDIAYTLRCRPHGTTLSIVDHEARTEEDR